MPSSRPTCQSPWMRSVRPQPSLSKLARTWNGILIPRPDVTDWLPDPEESCRARPPCSSSSTSRRWLITFTTGDAVEAWSKEKQMIFYDKNKGLLCKWPSFRKPCPISNLWVSNPSVECKAKSLTTKTGSELAKCFWNLSLTQSLFLYFSPFKNTVT